MLAIITGASSGIGRDLARVLADKGCNLILVARRKDKLDELAKELNTKVKVINLDLSLENNVFKLYESVKNEEIDILINNAGFGLFGVFHETNEWCTPWWLDNKNGLDLPHN